MEILLSVNIPSCLVSMLSTLMLLTLTFFFLTNADVKDRLGNYLYNTIHYLFSYIYIYLNTIVILKHYQLLKVTHINFEKQNGNLIIVSHSVVYESLQPHGLSMEFSRQEYRSGLSFPSPNLIIIQLKKML